LFPEKHRRRIRTVNMLERINKEIRRRTRVASLFPNAASCLRLVSAVTMEISEDWQTGKKYPVFDKQLFCRSHSGTEKRYAALPPAPGSGQALSALPTNPR
jgi:transposase-like protein